VLMISHRLSTLGNVDEIIVLSEGRIVERGTYSELKRQRGVFAHLVEEQSRYSAERGGERVVSTPPVPATAVPVVPVAPAPVVPVAPAPFAPVAPAPVAPVAPVPVMPAPARYAAPALPSTPAPVPAAAPVRPAAPAPVPAPARAVARYAFSAPAPARRDADGDNDEQLSLATWQRLPRAALAPQPESGEPEAQAPWQRLLFGHAKRGRSSHDDRAA